MTTTTRENILATHGLTECVRVSIPPVRARNHGQAVAALKARRAALLEHADYLAFLAAAFVDAPEVADVLLTEARDVFTQAQKLAGASC